MEWKDIQPIATMIGAITAAIISAITLWKLQSKKRNDDIDLKSLGLTQANKMK